MEEAEDKAREPFRTVKFSHLTHKEVVFLTLSIFQKPTSHCLLFPQSGIPDLDTCAKKVEVIFTSASVELPGGLSRQLIIIPSFWQNTKRASLSW